MLNNMEKKQEAKMNIRLNVPVSFKIVESKADGEKGVVEAYVSIFDNVDLVGDVIVKGAFAESLAKKLPVGVWSHNWDEPIAKTLEAREDDKGLYIKGKFIEGVQRAEEAYKLLKEGVITEFSIGFRVLDDEWREDGVRVIKKAKLYEWSPVLAGANPDTEVISVKSEKKCDDCENEVPENNDQVEGEKESDEKCDEEKEIKIDFIKTEKGKITLHFREGGEKKVVAGLISYKYKKYLTEQKALKKVENNVEVGKATQKTLRIRQVAKQNLKAMQYILKIIK